MVESQPSKLLVAGSIPVSRSKPVRSAECGVRNGYHSPFRTPHSAFKRADVAQLVERVLGKDEVTGSIPVIGSSNAVTSDK